MEVLGEEVALEKDRNVNMEAVRVEEMELSGEEDNEQAEDEETELVDLETEDAEIGLEEVVVDEQVDGGDVEPDEKENSGISRSRSCPLDLPIAVTRRIVKSATNKRISPELLVAFSRIGGAFALYLLSASQEASVASKRSTIRPVEIIEGLIACGFPEIAEEVRVTMNIEIKKKRKKQS